MKDQTTENSESDSSDRPDASNDRRGGPSEEERGRDKPGETSPPPTPPDASAEDDDQGTRSGTKEGFASRSSRSSRSKNSALTDDSSRSSTNDGLFENTADLEDSTSKKNDDSNDGPEFEVPETQVLESDSDASERDQLDAPDPPPASSFLDNPRNLRGSKSRSRGGTDAEAPDGPIDPPTLNEGSEPPTLKEGSNPVELDEESDAETQKMERTSFDVEENREDEEEELALPSPGEITSPTEVETAGDSNSNRLSDDRASNVKPPAGQKSSDDTDVSRAPETDINPSPRNQNHPTGASDAPDATRLDPGPPANLEEAEEGFFDRLPIPELRSGRAMGIAAGIVVLTVLIALGFGAKFATSLDADRLATALERAEQHRSSDTYSAWLDAYRSTETDLSIVSAPDSARSFIHTIGAFLGSESPSSLRDEIGRRHAYYAAVLEYRFERSGSRKAASLADNAFGGESEKSPLAQASAIYRELSRDRLQPALERARTADAADAYVPELTHAQLEAHLRTKNGDDITEIAAEIERNGDDDSTYRQYLLAKAARHASGASASELLQKLVDESDSEHLGAAIAHTDQIRREGDLKKAAREARTLLDRRSSEASDYQRAKLHLILGQTYLEMEETDRAHREFEAATRIEPGRTSVYLPLIDQLLQSEDLKRAGKQIERAAAMAYTTSALQRRRARHAYLSGEFRRALSALEHDEFPVDAAILHGRILIALERYQSAEDVLAEVEDAHPRSRAARALDLLSRVERKDVEPDMAIDRLDSILADSRDSPLLWRSAARIRLRLGERSTGSARDEHLEAATRYARKAADAQPNRALNEYLLCETHLVRRQAASARDACRRARRQNPDYFPGVLTVARLKLELQDSEAVELLLDGRPADSPHQWAADELRVRAALQTGRIEGAREIVSQWSDDAEAPLDRVNMAKGLIAFAAAEYDKSLEHFKKVQKETEDDAEARLYYTHALVRLGKNEESAAASLRKLNEHPQWSGEAWLIFGELRRRQDRFGDALENLRYAERNLKHDFVKTMQLSHLYAERLFTWEQRFDWDKRQLREILEDAREVDEPWTPDLHLALGLYNLQKESPDLEAAISHLTKVVERQPSRCRAVLGLQKAYEKRDEDGSDDSDLATIDVESLVDEHCGS